MSMCTFGISANKGTSLFLVREMLTPGSEEGNIAMSEFGSYLAESGPRGVSALMLLTPIHALP